MSKEAKWGVWGAIIAAVIGGVFAVVAALVQRQTDEPNLAGEIMYTVDVDIYRSSQGGSYCAGKEPRLFIQAMGNGKPVAPEIGPVQFRLNDPAKKQTLDFGVPRGASVEVRLRGDVLCNPQADKQSNGVLSMDHLALAFVANGSDRESDTNPMFQSPSERRDTRLWVKATAKSSPVPTPNAGSCTILWR